MGICGSLGEGKGCWGRGGLLTIAGGGSKTLFLEGGERPREKMLLVTGLKKERRDEVGRGDLKERNEVESSYNGTSNNKKGTIIAIKSGGGSMIKDQE